ncbi:MAG: ribosome maturation factor RimM [Acidimicrobiales bacterium]
MAPALLEVGRVLRPHGLRGQVVVELWTNREERMAAGAVMVVAVSASAAGAARELTVARATPTGTAGVRGRWLVTFEGVADRESAEALRGAVLLAEPQRDPGVLWAHEVIGAQVVDAAGALIGTVVALQSNPASDLLVLDGGHLIPLRFISSDEPGRLTVDLPPGLLDL